MTGVVPSLGTARLSPRRYRLLDRVSKLLGVALVAGGLEAGGNTVTGVALGALGVTSALVTVLLAPTEGNGTASEERDEGRERGGDATTADADDGHHTQ